jgi:hypothetical protein
MTAAKQISDRPTRAVERPSGTAGLVAAPRDVLIGTNQHQPRPMRRFGLAGIDDFQRRAAAAA